MNPVHVAVKRALCRRLSLMTPMHAWKKNSCEDCCGNAQPKPTIYVERTCHPCSFFSWKPKIPILEAAPPLVDVRKKPYKKKHCYAGMKIMEKSLAEIKKEAAECLIRCASKPVCPPPPPPPPPAKVRFYENNKK